MTALYRDSRAPEGNAVLALDQRVVTVRDRFQMDQMLVLNAQAQVRTNLVTRSALSTSSLVEQVRPYLAQPTAQTQLVQTTDTWLLISIVRVQSPPGTAPQRATGRPGRHARDGGRSRAHGSRTPGAIGYVGFGNLRADVVAVTIDGIAPSPQTVQQRTYRLTRPLSLLVGSLSRPLARAFIQPRRPAPCCARWLGGRASGTIRTRGIPHGGRIVRRDHARCDAQRGTDAQRAYRGGTRAVSVSGNRSWCDVA